MMTVEKQVKLFMYFMYLIGLLGGTAVGLVMILKSFGETRETRLEIYQEDIDEWATIKRPEFLGNKFWIQNIREDDTLVTSTNYLPSKTEDSVEHQIAEDKYGDIPEYDPLYYSSRNEASSFGVDSNILTFNSTQKLKFNILVGEGASQQSVTVPELPLYSIKTSKMSNGHG